MATRHDNSPRADDASGGALPSGHQGFVREGDVQDENSQAAAPQRPGRAFDRSGEKHYQHDLQRFEAEHEGELPTSAAESRNLDDEGGAREEICRQFAADPRLARQPIEVNISDGVVTLSGHVETEAARERAEEIAAAAAASTRSRTSSLSAAVEVPPRPQ